MKGTEDLTEQQVSAPQGSEKEVFSNQISIDNWNDLLSDLLATFAIEIVLIKTFYVLDYFWFTSKSGRILQSYFAEVMKNMYFHTSVVFTFLIIL